MDTQSPNPLKTLHDQAEAEFQPYGDIEIVSTFGEPQAEYAAIHKGCALIDCAQRGIIQATGPDRIDFLNRLLTNQLVDKETKTPLAAGAGVYSFILNNKGRIVADMNILERENRTLIETDARNIPTILSILQKHIFSEKVEFTPLIGQAHQIELHGPTSYEVLRNLFGDLPPLGILGSTSDALPDIKLSEKLQFDKINSPHLAAPLAERSPPPPGIAIPPLIIWRDDPCGVPGYTIVVPAEHAPKLWMQILSAFPAAEPGKRPVRPAGWAVFNTARIEAGRPLFGIDFDDTILPAETAQLSRAVSFTKGCYLGQEIVARMHARNQLARQLVGIKMREDALPIAGAPIIDKNQTQIGGITSSTISPILSGASICLALIKSAFAPIGTELQIAAEGAFRTGIVTELPFIK